MLPSLNCLIQNIAAWVLSDGYYCNLGSIDKYVYVRGFDQKINNFNMNSK